MSYLYFPYRGALGRHGERGQAIRKTYSNQGYRGRSLLCEMLSVTQFSPMTHFRQPPIMHQVLNAAGKLRQMW